MTDLTHRPLQLPDETHAARLDVIKEEERFRAVENSLAYATAERYMEVAETTNNGHFHTQYLVESDPAVRRARDTGTGGPSGCRSRGRRISAWSGSVGWP